MGRKGRPEGRATPTPATSAGPLPLPPRWLAVGLVAAVLVVFLPPLRQAGWVYDDALYVSGEPRMADGLTPQSIRWALVSGDGGIWYPVTRLSHLLDVTLFGPGPAGPHVVNVLLHGANAALLFLLLRAGTGAVGASAFAAALFALHPLRVEPVAWVTSRKDLLSTLFWLLAVGAWGRWRRGGGGANRWATAAFFALGLASKPMVVTLPFTLVLVDAWPLGIVPTNREALLDGRALRALRRSLVDVAPLLGLALVGSLVAWRMQGAAGALEGGAAIPLVERAGHAVVSLVVYLAKFAWPFGLSPFYPWPAAPWSAGAVLGSLLLLAAIAALAATQLARRPFVAVGLAIFAGTLVPVLGLVPFGAHAWADRFTYVPAIGLSAAVAFAAAGAMTGERRRFAMPAALVLLGLLALASRRQAAAWASDETLFRHALALDGRNPVALQYVGRAEADAGRAEEAVVLFGRAVEVRPGWTMPKANLLAALRQAGRTAEAVERGRIFVAKHPGDAGLHEELAHALAESGKFDEAAGEYDAALRLDPGRPAARYNAGVVALRLGRPEAALAHFGEAVRLDPARVEARANYGRALLEAGRTAEAVEQLREARRLRPDAPEIAGELARAEERLRLGP